MSGRTSLGWFPHSSSHPAAFSRWILRRSAPLDDRYSAQYHVPSPDSSDRHSGPETVERRATVHGEIVDRGQTRFIRLTGGVQMFRPRTKQSQRPLFPMQTVCQNVTQIPQLAACTILQSLDNGSSCCRPTAPGSGPRSGHIPRARPSCNDNRHPRRSSPHYPCRRPATAHTV